MLRALPWALHGARKSIDFKHDTDAHDAHPIAGQWSIAMGEYCQVQQGA